MKLLFSVVLLFTVGAVVKAQQDYVFPDYWENDYDNSLYDAYNAADDVNENTDVKQAEPSNPAEIQDVNLQITAPAEQENKEFDVLEDYQIEDNRSDAAEKGQVDDNKEVAAEEAVPDNAPITEKIEEHEVLPLEDDKEFGVPEQEESKELNPDDMWGNFGQDDVAPLPVPTLEDQKDILEETRDILNKEQDYLDDLEPSPITNKNIDQIIEETNNLLAEGNDSFEANDYDNSDEQEQEQSEEDVFSENNDEIEEDTPEKIYADLNADLDKLRETIEKLKDDNPDEDKENDEHADNIQDYEEKYGKPYNEDVALSWRNVEADAAEPINSKEDHDDADDNENNDDDYEVINDSNLSQIFADVAEKQNEPNENDEQELVEFDLNNNAAVENVALETTAIPIENNDEVKEPIDYINNYDEPSDNEPNADDDIDSVIQQIFNDDIKEPQSYGNDGLVDEKQPKNEYAIEFEAIEANNTNIEENIEQKSVMVDDLSSAELSDVMTQFVAAHSQDFDVNSEKFEAPINPIRITLSVDEPTIIESPEYPKPYPTNQTIDWLFDGPGTGIELNITDFAVNGALGDYLLVKPGGVNESGSDGLIFSYRLTSERRYRFSDVNRMFVRFKANEGFPFQKGFLFSVKLMWPLPLTIEDLPVPEPVLNPPEETLTLNLAGLTLPKFIEIKKDFIELIADMSKAYIRDNNIDQGLNTTYEVTQITRTAVCNIQWPEYENCVEVTFGVPLHYEEETEPRLNAKELNDMWTTYVIKEQFSERLRSLGITEYAIPNDRTVLMVWLVIAVGVLISMAMLAIALWRFSCFEDYTRMKSYGDADSIQNEKRKLDLYPTPHQTLPPLYAENDYKWADDKYDDSTRVDMGGFANKSYMRDELFDLDSDEDVITTRDRKGVISPRDYYDA